MIIMDKLSLEHHLTHLEKVHRELDGEIIKEEKHYGNDALVKTMKKKKLQLKTEIEHLRKTIQYEIGDSR
jgi:hypothetical protein